MRPKRVHNYLMLLPMGLVASCIFMSGCGQPDWQAKTHPAGGEYFVNGAPAEGAFIYLTPIEQKVDVRESRPWGMVDANGHYKLRTYEAGDGAPAGDYQVSLVWRFDPMGQAETDRMNFVYADAQKNPWTFTVKPGKNELPKIDLTDVKLLDGPPKRSRRPPSPLDTE